MCREFLTGFHKRNLEKKDKKKKNAIERDKQERLRLRREQREEIKDKARENARVVEAAYGHGIFSSNDALLDNSDINLFDQMNYRKVQGKEPQRPHYRTKMRKNFSKTKNSSLLLQL